MGFKHNNQSDLKILIRRSIYLQLRDLFLARIKASEWRQTQLLPNELHLANQFEVSVGTIRKVMDDLSLQGLVSHQHGRGIFVVDLAGSGNGVFDSIRNAGGSPVVWDLPRVTVVVGEATAAEAKQLGRGRPPFEVVRLSWLNSRNKRVIAFQEFRNRSCPRTWASM